MKYLALLLSLFSFQTLLAQSTADTSGQQVVPVSSTSTPKPKPIVAAQVAVEDKTLSLQERFLIMKSKSQTYGDYKVIKEVVLDGVWKITRDSINGRKATMTTAKATIANLKAEGDSLKTALQQKEASVEGILYDSTHISVLGINMGKQFFIGIVAIIFAALTLAILFVTGRLKLMYSSIKEKADLVSTINGEYEEFRRKALDKQTKLSRELQNERNKLAELRR